MKLTKPQVAKAAELFGLSQSEQALLNETPYRGTRCRRPPADLPILQLVMVTARP